MINMIMTFKGQSDAKQVSTTFIVSQLPYSFDGT